MKLSPEKQKSWILTIVVMTLLIVVTWYFAVQGLQKKQTRDTKESIRLEGEAKNRQIQILTETNNREQAKSFQNYIMLQEEQMPKANPDTWLVRELSELAGKHKFQINNTTLQEIKELSDFKFKDQPYKLVGLRFDFKGDYNQIGSFLQDLENNLPLMEVDDLSITSGSEAGPHIHTVTMRVSMVIKQ